MNYSIKKESGKKFEDTLIELKEGLKVEGFGVLTEIDVAEKLREKINVTFPKYTILGACDPVFAHKALQAEQEIGLFLPCNVIVYEDGAGKVFVSAIRPTAAMKMIDNAQLQEISVVVEERLEKIINNLQLDES